jgi:hypothetical protein
MAKRKASKKTACKRDLGKFIVTKTGKSICLRVKPRKAGAKKRGSKKGIGKMTTAERKAMMRKTCKKVSAAKRKKMAGLCKWARS